ncbi:MAG: hypothetical protein RMJ38_02475 [candidate division WOR-3 bacterium]|nr:hypothetical protein [candidate division WOR-3 bacterium]MDW8150292.1 hypothetical protein [candidate division WOR-3 bacterium]
MIALLRDSVNLISDTIFLLNSVVFNSFLTNGGFQVILDSSRIYVRPLQTNTKVYYEKVFQNTSLANFFESNEENSYFNFFGSAFWKVGFSSGIEQNQGISANINGTYRNYKISAIVKSYSTNRTITLEELEESYLNLSSSSLHLNSGIFNYKNYRIFGINVKSNRFFGVFGYERYLFERMDIYLEENNRGPYKFSRNYNIVYGSIKVYLNGVKLEEDDYIANYDMGTIILKPNVVVKKGDRLTIEYQYTQIDGQREHIELGYGNIGIYQLRKIIKYESDTIKYIESPGYYPSYYKSDRGSYNKIDSIFVYVGEGSGEYIVRFFPFLGGSYEYNSQGNFYYFVGKGKGNYEPLEYYEPPRIEREINFKFTNGKFSILEVNPNYFKYNVGKFDFESDLNFKYNSFSFGIKRKKRVNSEYTLPRNILFSNLGNYIYVKFFNLEPYILDNFLGIKLEHKNIYFDFISNRRKLNLNFQRDVFFFEYDYNFIDSAFSRISFKTNTAFYPIYNLRISKNIENEIGFGINSNIFNFIGFYVLEKQNLQFRIFKTMQNYSFDINYISEPNVVYLERYIFVGDGFGSYSYDAKSNTYYYDSHGSYIKQIYPIYISGKSSYIIGSFYMNYKNADISFSKGKDNLFFAISSSYNYASYSKQLDYEEINSKIKYRIFTLKSKYFNQRGILSYLKNSIGVEIKNFELGIGIYSRTTPFVYLEFRRILNFGLEYRFSSYSEYIPSGLDLNLYTNYVFRIRNYNIVIFGSYGYNPIRTYRNFGLNVMLNF